MILNQPKRIRNCASALSAVGARYSIYIRRQSLALIAHGTTG